MFGESIGECDPVDAAIFEYLKAQDSGEAFDIDGWLDRHAAYRDALLDFLDDQALAGAVHRSPEAEMLGRDLEVTTEFNVTTDGEGVSAAASRASDPPAPATTAPQQIGEIRLGRLLGAGGMGRVYEGVDASNQRVAVKLLAPVWARSQESISRFRKEGALASLVNHPRCVFVRSADTDQGIPYIVMELMPGDTLKDLVTSRGALPYREAVRLILDVVEGLEEAHSHGMIHRDVKPANCYLEANGRVKIGDFGLARSVVQPSELTVTGGFVGTPLYASPEQIRGKQLDARTDIYSLTATLYFLITGRAPFASDNSTQTIARIVSEDPPSVREQVPSVPVGLERVIAKGLARDPDKRVQTMAELRHALRPFVVEHAVSAPLGLRIGAMLVDVGINSMVVSSWLVTQNPQLFLTSNKASWFIFLGAPIWFIYLFLQEGLFGATLGKRLFRLRVVDSSTLEAASWGQCFLRTITYVLMTGVGAELILIGLDKSITSLPYYSLYLLIVLLGYGVLLTTYRPRRERILAHDALSRTRVMNVQSDAEEYPADIQSGPVYACDDGAATSLGRFSVIAALTDPQRSVDGRRVLLAQDPQLERKVWLVSLTDVDTTAANDAVHGRTTRLRLVQRFSDGAQPWGAFIAVEGESVEQLIARDSKWEWSQVRSLLKQLCDEFLACRDTTAAPAIRSLSQVWVDKRGRLIILDFPLNPISAPKQEPMPPVNVAWEMSHGLLSSGVGKRRIVELARTAPSTPLPAHAARLLERLKPDGKKPFENISQLRDELLRTDEYPTRVALKQRVVQIALMTLVLSGVYGATLSLSRLANQMGLIVAGDGLLVAELARRMSDDDGLYQPWLEQASAAGATTGRYASAQPPAQSELSRLADALDRKFAEEYETRYKYTTLLHSIMLENGPFQPRLIEERSSYKLAVPQASSPLAADNDYLQGRYRFTRNSEPQGVRGVRQLYQTAELSPREIVHHLVDATTDYRPYHAKLLFLLALTTSPLWLLWLWDIVFRGGWCAWLVGIRYVDRKNRPASFARFIVRSSLIWGPMVGWGVMITVLEWGYSEANLAAATNLFTIYQFMPLPFIISTLLYPPRGWYDRIAGTYAVPR